MPFGGQDARVAVKDIPKLRNLSQFLQNSLIRVPRLVCIPRFYKVFAMLHALARWLLLFCLTFFGAEI